jgi:hypothetical protein
MKSKYELLSGLCNATYIELTETHGLTQVLSFVLFLSLNFKYIYSLFSHSQFSNVLIKSVIYIILDIYILSVILSLFSLSR